MFVDLESRSVQFFSRSFSQPCHDVSWTRQTSGGRHVSLSGKVSVGTKRLCSLGAPSEQRALFTPPWPESPSIGAVEYVDPYGEERWPSYIMLEGRLELPNESYSVHLAKDVAQFLRAVVGWELLDRLSLPSAQDQRVMVPGYRWGYWTAMLDSVGNPAPTPYGSYACSEPGEAAGPGFVTLRNMGFSPAVAEPHGSMGGQPDISWMSGSLSQLNLALVWSQAFSLPNRTTASADHARIQKRVQEIRLHWNSYSELKDAEGHLARHDLKATIRSAAACVEAAVRFCCAEWAVPFPKRAGIPFNERIEQVLAAAKRHSYRSVNPDGSEALLHLYQARNAMHQGDNYFKDAATGKELRVDRAIATGLLDDARAFVLWLGSQA